MEDNYREIFYKKNFLDEVIIRIDFSNSITFPNNELPEKFRAEIEKLLPYTEPSPRNFFEGQIEFFPDGSIDTKNIIKAKEWRFFSEEGTGNEGKQLIINPKSIAIIEKKYISFENLASCFFTIFNLLLIEMNNITFSRLRLRYINNIKLKKGNPIFWKGYFTPSLLSMFNVPRKEERKFINRIFHTLEFNYDDFNLRFQYGIYNPDYPSTIKRKEFVLDYDAFCSGILEKEEIKEYLLKFHSKIQYLFENSVTDKLRKEMS